MEPYMESLSRRFISVLDIVKVNVDDAADIAKASNVSSIPTLLYYSKGQVIKVEMGIKDEAHLTGVVTDLLKTQL
jgi:thioredoxin-like negative regulator of GroEL